LREGAVVLVIGLALAALSAAASNVGFLLRHRGAVSAPDVDARHLLRSAIELFKSKWWTIGYLVAFIAYGFHVGALALAPLSLVQAVLAGGIVLLGVIAERYFGAELGKREWIGLVLTGVGLAFLALTAGGTEDGQESADYSVAAMIAFEAAMVGLGTALLLAHRSPAARGREGPLLGVAAGLLFTVTHVAIKAATGKLDATWVDVVLSPFLLIAILGGVAAFFISARSLQLGPAVAVIAVTSIAGNASSIPAGIVVFGDPLGADAFTAIARSLAFVMVIVAAALIPAPTRAAKDPAEEPVPPERAGVAQTASAG
jgi:drug/metabolite transporter (DMT)-like permease